MFGASFRIGSIGGVVLRVDTSWVIGVLLVTYSWWVQFDAEFLSLDTWPALALAALASILFFGSVLAHELAHAGMARARGIAVSGITLFLFGGATAANLEDRGPKDEFLVTVVGPASSLALAGVFWAVAQAGSVVSEPVAGAFGRVGWVNLLLAGFNVVPGFPLDGGRMLRSILWRVTGDMARATRIAAAIGQAIGLLLMGLGIVIALDLLSVLSLSTFTGVWLAAIGWMLYGAARAASRDAGVRKVLARGTAAEAMGPPPPSIPAGIPLSEALDRYLMGHERETFPVEETERVVGLINFAAARRVGKRDPLRPVREAMLPLSHGVTVALEEPLDQVAERLGARRLALVLDNGALVGSITQDDLSRWVRARATS